MRRRALEVQAEDHTSNEPEKQRLTSTPGAGFCLFDVGLVEVHASNLRFRRSTSNTANIAPTSASSRFTSGTCDIVVGMFGSAFCSYSLDVCSSVPVGESVRESSESGKLPAVRFQAPSGWAAALGSRHFVELVESTCGEVQRWMGDEFGSACQDSIAFFDQLRSNHHLHRHPELYRTTLCVSGPRNQIKTSS